MSNKLKKTGIVQLLEPEFGIAPGQACVFYNNFKKVIGGGWITAGEKKTIIKVNTQVKKTHFTIFCI